MNKLGVTFLVLFFACIATTATKGDEGNANAASPPTKSGPKWPWFPWGPHAPPMKKPFPWAHAMPPLPSGSPSFEPKKAQSCLKAFKAEQTCVHEIFASFWNKKVQLDPDCCKTIQEVSEECTDTVFACFNSPFFGLLLKEHCAKKA